MKKTALNYDAENDILYLVIGEGEEDHFVEVSQGVVVEFDENDKPIGLEIFEASKVMMNAIGRERLALAGS
jgi:uncharacterized protein YuzE